MGWETIIISISSGIIGSILGIFLSPYINYRFNIRFLKKEVVFKERVKNYEKVRERIDTLEGIYKRTEEEGSKIKLMEKIIRDLTMFVPLKEYYLSKKVKILLEDYKNLIEKNSKKEKLTQDEAVELINKFSKYTQRTGNISRSYNRKVFKARNKLKLK